MTTFDGKSTIDQVLDGVDVRAKRILVTGASAGVGFETARALVAHGAEVVGTARDMAKARLAADAILSPSDAGGRLEWVELDLASLSSVRRLADLLLDAGQPLDLIIANAGLMAGPKASTEDGFEAQFGINHLGHFVLINRLAPLVRSGGRVACVSSAGHRRSDVDLDDPNFATTPYDELVAYGRSKTAVVLFAVEFDRRHRDRGVRATAVHPGAIRTETVRKMIAGMIAAGRDPRASSYDWKTVQQGAATSVWAGLVAAADAVGGAYCEDCHVADVDDDRSHPAGVRAYALDPARAEALWRRSEEMAAERF